MVRRGVPSGKSVNRHRNKSYFVVSATMSYDDRDIAADIHHHSDNNEDVVHPQCLLQRLRILSTVRNTRPLGTPTTALPGSKEKVRVLAKRYQLGQDLWHPLDVKAK